MRTLRGGVLGHGFDIEHAAVTLILAKTFGTLDPKEGGPSFVERSNALEANEYGLQRKIDDVRPIIREALNRQDADALVQDLAEYRRLRHLMAHRPCWLESIWAPDAGDESVAEKGRTTGFRLFIADSDFVWEIDQQQVQQWEKLLSRCKSGLEGVRALYYPKKN